MATTVLNVTGEETLWLLALSKLVFLPSPSRSKGWQNSIKVCCWEFSEATGQEGAFQRAQVGLEGAFKWAVYKS